MIIKRLAIGLFVSGAVCQPSFADFQHELVGTFAKGTMDSEQQHKNQDLDYYSGEYSYFLTPVEVFSELPAESRFFSHSAFISFELDRSVLTPKDDFLIAKAIFDWSSPIANHRLRIGAISGENKTERENRHFNGALLGVSVYLLETAKIDFDTNFASGDDFEISETSIQFRQVYLEYDYDVVFELGFEYDSYKSPYSRVGRRAYGFSESSWNMRVGWYFLPTLQLGLGHRAESRDYRITDDNSSKNALLVYGEWTPEVDMSFFFEGAVAREVIEIANTDLESTDDSGRFDVGIKLRF